MIANPVVTTAVRSWQPERNGLFLPFVKGRRWVPLSRIIRLEGIGNYTQVYFSDGSQLLVAITLKVFESRLPLNEFARPHRKHLLNWQYICTVYRPQKEIILENGERFAIARRRTAEFMKEYRQRRTDQSRTTNAGRGDYGNAARPVA